MQQRLLGLLFSAFALGFGLIAVFSALAGGVAWVVGISAGVLALWMGDFARRLLARRRS